MKNLQKFWEGEKQPRSTVGSRGPGPLDPTVEGGCFFSLPKFFRVPSLHHIPSVPRFDRLDGACP